MVLRLSTIETDSVVDRRWVRVGSRWCLQTGSGVVIGRAWQPEARPPMSADAERWQQLMARPAPAKPIAPRVIDLDNGLVARALRAVQRLLNTSHTLGTR